MKNYYILFMMIIMTSLSYGQIFITEIADPEDATTCRFVELYNAGATAVDLAAAGYKIQRYTNDSTTPQTAVPLTGTIAAGGFFIISRSGFQNCFGFAPDLILPSGTVADGNGDDKIQLLNNVDAVVDIFGVVGELSAGTCHWHQDGRAERIATVTTGNNGVWNEAKWNVTGLSATTPVGCTNHTNASVKTTDGVFDPGAWIGAPVTNTVVSLTTVENSVSENVGTVDVCVSITNPAAGVATSVELVLSASSTAINGTDYASITFPYVLTFPAGSTSDQCLTITIINDSDVEPLENIVFELQNPSGGNSAALGTIIMHTLSIEPSDLNVPNVGDIIVTEIMQNPDKVSDANGEWFEVHNITTAPIDMNGWKLTDHNSSSYLNNTIGTTIVPAGGYLVLSTNGDSSTNGNIPVVNYDFGGSGTGLGNALGSIVLTAENTEIDRVDWTNSGSFPVPTGASMELSTTAYNSVLNDNGANWGLGTTAYGDGDLGTPGTVNDFTLAVNLNEIEGFEVYPNPVNTGVFRINSSSKTYKSIYLYDVQGKKVFSSVIENNGFINVSSLKPGLYILKVDEEGNLATRKLIIK
ncbi:lamin tail domain-containing protein [Mariniflexile sp.]|uniref:lamin tail domain-containing protein n=1 Tax=Mariniflexile sp. TaxID=1979402 RepID=UPI0040471A60